MGAAGGAVAIKALGDIGGAIVTAQQQRAAGLARQGYFEFIARQAQGQANLAEIRGVQQSRAIQDAAAKNFTRFQRNIKRARGAQAAAIAASGLAGTVTAQDIALDAEASNRLDELAIRFNADSQSDEVLLASRLEAGRLRSDVIQNRFAGQEARRRGFALGRQTLLSAATTTAVDLGTFAGGRFDARRTTTQGPRRVGRESFATFRRRTSGRDSLLGRPSFSRRRIDLQSPLNNTLRLR